MKKILLMILTGAGLLMSNHLAAQAPQGFTYQAVATTSGGSPIANTTLDVKIGILSDTLNDIYVWEEQHSVSTNGYGLFTLIVGEGTRLQGPPAFSEIDWSLSPLYLRTQVRYQSVWRTMDAARIWSVPFSIISTRTSGVSEGAKLSVVSNDDTSQEPLFEIRRKDGQVVFAVYSDAVNVFVPDSVGKGKKGGFAIGGFDKGKGISQDLFTVTSDSIRMYINDTVYSKGSKGGFAIGGFSDAKVSDRKYLSLYGKKVVDNITDVSQILWYPNKEAFLAGNITIEDPDSVGRNSFSTGYRNKAIGNFSHALGYESIARGDFSTAIGRRATSGLNSFALGNFSSATGQDSYAVGSGAKALGNTSMALGVGSIASGQTSIAMGNESEATNLNAVAIGFQSKAKNIRAHAFGLKSEASGIGSLALGMFTKANGSYSTSLGYWSEASTQYSMAIGYYAKATGYDSYAMGSFVEAGGEESFAIGSFGLKDDGTPNTLRPTKTLTYYSLAFGMGAQATNIGSMALGINTSASGPQSISIGFGTEASAQFATALGYRSAANGFKSIAIGGHYNVSFYRLKWVANIPAGTWDFVRELVTLDKPNVASGEYSVSLGNGNSSNQGGLALGTNNSANGFGSVAIGHSNIADSAFSFVAGYNNIATGIKAFAMGENLEAQSANSFVLGAFNLIEGSKNVWVPTDPLFVIGNGNPTARSNAFKILKDGTVVLSNVPLVPGGVPLYVNADGSITRQVSSARYKRNILPLTDVSWIYSLNPVSFTYITDITNSGQYGLIAEEVEAVNKNLVVYREGKPESVNYNGLFAPILKTIQEQKKEIDNLKARNQELEQSNSEMKERLDRLEKLINRNFPEKE